MIKNIEIHTEFIKLDQFLKYVNEVSTGGEAKDYILNSKVKVNSEIELRRGRKLRNNDIIEINNNTYKVIINL